MAEDSGPATREELRTQLDTAIIQAHHNGVAVNDTAFELLHQDAGTPDWDVQITKVL